MVFKTLTPSQLCEFIYSREYEEMKTIPISRHRALSHIHNPRVSENDTVLILAYENDALAGYLGILADKIFLNEKEVKAGWLSCMWVDPNLRGKGIAKKLLDTALAKWDRRILGTEFTPSAKSLYDTYGKFSGLKISEGLRGYLTFNLHELLPNKFPSLKIIQPLIKIADSVLNIFNNVRLFFYKPQNIITHKYVNEINEELAEFIRGYTQKQLTKRGAGELNWIIKFPWIISDGAGDLFSKRYDFSYWSRRFEFLNIVIYSEGKICGYMMLSVRNDHLRIPYFYAADEHLQEAVSLLYKIMLEMKLSMLTVYHPSLVSFLGNNKTPFFMKRTFRRHYIISKQFDDEVQKAEYIELQDGDADCVFT